jgi:hypothetical protein
MTKRIAAHEKFRWRGWEFRQSTATSKEVHWSMKHGKIEIRVIYRDIQDPEAPPEWTAIIHMQGLTSGEGSHTAGSGCGASVEKALAAAERDFESKLVTAVRLFTQLRRGKKALPADS